MKNKTKQELKDELIFAVTVLLVSLLLVTSLLAVYFAFGGEI